MMPTRSQFLLALMNGETGKEEVTLQRVESSLTNLKKNVLALKEFYIEHKLETIKIV